MSHKLLAPFTEKNKADFIVKYNHCANLEIYETKSGIYALEPWEKLVDNKVIEDKKAYLEKKDKLERERKSKLKLTKREIFLALYKKYKLTPQKIKELLETQEQIIEFEYANEYYRGNPLIDLVASKLAISLNEIDYLFEHGDFYYD